MKQLGIKVPVMQDANALSKSAVNFNLLATENSVELQNMVMTLDDTGLKAQPVSMTLLNPLLCLI